MGYGLYIKKLSNMMSVPAISNVLATRPTSPPEKEPSVAEAICLPLTYSVRVFPEQSAPKWSVAAPRLMIETLVYFHLKKI